MRASPQNRSGGWPGKKVMSTAALLLLLACGAASARKLVNTCPSVDVATSQNDLTVVAPILEYTVTTFDPGWFASNQSAGAPVLFTLVIDPSLKQYAGSLRLRVQITADTTLGRNPSAPQVMAFDRISDTLSADQIGVPLTSGQVFDLRYQTGGLDFNQSDLYGLVTQNHQAPEMNLHFRFRLTCEDAGDPLGNSGDINIAVVDPANWSANYGKLRYVNTVQALSPGTDASNPKPVSIYTLNPVFQIASELFNNQEFIYPPGEPKMRIYLYTVPAGTNPVDALQGMEFAQFPVPNQYPITYPAGLPQLTPGQTYVWRARATLRGPADEYLYSNALYFRVDPLLDNSGAPPSPDALSDLTNFAQQVQYGDDYVKRVMAALKIILGDNYDIFDVSRANKIPAKGQIRLNGQPYSLEELEALAREFQQSSHSVTRIRFQ